MTYQVLTDRQLHSETKRFSSHINRETIKLIDLLSEVNYRRSFADLGYNSLFTYIEQELGFSAAQASLYNSIIKSKLSNVPQVLELVKQEKVPLYVLGYAGNQIRFNKDKYLTPKEKFELVKKMCGKTRDEIRSEYGSIKKDQNTSPAKVVLDRKIWKGMQKVKRKIGSPWMTDSELIAFLVNKEIYWGMEPNNNKTITPRTRAIVLRKADHRCEYHTNNGKRCPATSDLQVDHILPRAKGGSNHPTNLRTLCRTHNLRGAFFEFRGRGP